MNRAIFLDRDGTLNALVYYADTQEYESPREAQALTLLPSIETALQSLSANGYSLFLVSNQPSYAKGKTSLENLQAVHTHLINKLAGQGVQLTEAYYCYHHPKGVVPAYTTVCNCRKPGIESLLRARDSYDLNLGESWMIGDQDSDIQCGLNAGCRTILLEYAPSVNKRDVVSGLQPDARCMSLEQAAIHILERAPN
jgi:D-glycero-D-manno-heptose 1,7-bisphosphate phosphatase